MWSFVLFGLLIVRAYGTRGYIGVAQKMDGYTAEQHCRNVFGTNLATITNAQENADAHAACNAVAPVDGECYIGLYRNTEYDEWGFRSSNIPNTPQGFNNWNQLCAIYSNLKNGRWDAGPCDNTVTTYPFVCDIDWQQPQSYCSADFTSWFRADQYDATTKTWTDLTGNGNDATFTAGSPTLSNDDGINGRPIVSGDTNARIQFGPAMAGGAYTVFSVARYTGGNKGRIIDGSVGNWLSGHHGGKAGVAFHETWLTPHTDTFGEGWVISSDAVGKYRGNGRTDLVNNPNTNSANHGKIQINYREQSNYALAELIIVNGEIYTDRKMSCIEDYLSRRYNIDVASTYTPGSSASVGFLNFNEGQGVVKGEPNSLPVPGDGSNYVVIGSQYLLYIIGILIILNIICIARYCMSKGSQRVKYHTVKMDSSTDADV